MKKGIHPENYRLVAFKDMSNGTTTITKSTAATKETIEIDGVEYPLVKMEISNSSHPFYTGKIKLIDTAGRVDKFMNRYKNHMENRKKFSDIIQKEEILRISSFCMVTSCRLNLRLCKLQVKNVILNL